MIGIEVEKRSNVNPNNHIPIRLCWTEKEEQLFSLAVDKKGARDSRGRIIETGRRKMPEKKTYLGIDWLRAIACIGIALMHIRENTSYQVSGFLYNSVIPSFTDFVYLFMAISAFGMCCGYYEKVMSGKVNWTEFYKKRYLKILPFFAVLIAADLIMNFSVGSVFEGLTEITLLHGFIPQSLSVIGVGWYLGTVFAFYLIFPFFCTLIQNRKNAWSAFAVSIGLHCICANYFELDRHNIVFSLCFFLVGGLIYLYRKELSKGNSLLYFVILCVSLGLYYLLGSSIATILLVVSLFLISAISIGKRLQIISFISDLSMEIYLSHMVMFRVVERMGLNRILGKGWLQYIMTSILVILSAVIFSYVLQRTIKLVEKKIGV